MTKDIVILGVADGLAIASFIETLTTTKNATINLLGFLDDFIQTDFHGYPLLGKLKQAGQLCKRENTFFVSALLKAKQSYFRSNLLKELNIPITKFITIIHPTATIARSAKIGVGTVVGPHVNIMPNVTIGNHCSIRACANIGHDSTIEDFCYVGPNATLGGRCNMKAGSHLAPNSCVLENTTLGAYSVVGIGSSVIRDVTEFAVVFGCPARKVGTANK